MWTAYLSYLLGCDGKDEEGEHYLYVGLLVGQLSQHKVRVQDQEHKEQQLNKQFINYFKKK